MIYRIEVSEAAEAEIDAAYLWICSHSPDRAGRWHEGLLRAVESLAEMPNRCPSARESSYFEGEVRQLLYGRGQGLYRIIFAVHEPVDGNDEPTVRILHIRHAAQQGIGEE